MAAISLREYVREIEKQVDGGRNEEAIAHSRHVLETFPKHVEVYRLLGKAYLESQRYGDAGDIFQRVLSSIPEDFVAHVGMSIIREDEGNFDEAIWHMERAFDAQPSNGAIQEELRRLYGRRDQIEPPKIRLTRGALARMYYRGDLYPQAIAELRAALSESPERLDLQVLLAEVYARSGQRVEAVDMAGQVLRKLPFSLAANQIMVDMLKGTERESEIETFTQRLNQLDPYNAYITPATPGAENVPDMAVRLTKLDYVASKASQEGAGQPIWAATLGIAAGDLASGKEEPPPTWLTAGPTPAEGTGEPLEGDLEPAGAGEAAEAVAAGQAVLPPETAEEEQIPDWMKEMGWGPASEESRAAEAAIGLEEALEAQAAPAEPAEDELEAAEIPEWLKAMAPPEALTEVESQDVEEDVAPWLEQLFSSELQTGASLSLEEPAEETGPPASLGWLAMGAAAGAAMLNHEDEPVEETPALEDELGEAFPEEAIPAWLLEIQPEAPSGEQPVEPAPAWLEETSPEVELTEAASAQELPDWLSESIPPAGSGEQLPDWSSDETPEREEIHLEEAVAEAGAEPAPELPEWLFEGQAAATEETPTEADAEGAEALPDWLFESETRTELAAELPEDLPDWLFESTPGEAEREAPEKEAGEAQEIPDWLKAAGIAVGGVMAHETSEWVNEEKELEEDTLLASTEIEGEPAEALLAEELPEWLRVPEEIEGPAAMEPEQDLLAALETALADEASNLETPDEGSEEVILAVAETIELGDTQPTSVQVAEPAPEISPELAEAFAWLDMMLTPVEEIKEEAVTEEALLVEVEAEPPSVGEPPAETVSGTAAPLDEDAAFAWMESLAVRQGASEALLLTPEERLETPPEWVQQAALEESAAAQAEAIETVPETQAADLAAEIEPETTPEAAPELTEAPLGDDASFAWLESLAVRQGASEALLLTPEERQETPPDWLAAAAAAGVAAVAVEKASAEPEPAAEAFEETPSEPPVAEETALAWEDTVEAEQPPELPDWLATPVAEVQEEPLEWTPPPVARQKYDLNKITLAELERLPGVGFIMAQRIIDHRSTHAPYKEVDDLLNVPDFNLATLEGIRDYLYIEARPEPTPAAARVPTQPRPITDQQIAASLDLPEEVQQARRHLDEGALEQALGAYSELIHSRMHLGWVIDDLSQASQQFPADFSIWQNLGDAYVRTDQPAQALQAYIQAEKLLLN